MARVHISVNTFGDTFNFEVSASWAHLDTDNEVCRLAYRLLT